ncbi:MAG TPA: fumarylacetoacetate hydrolase family protein, partial [Terriglobia bacterium]|nr:fumarylacetoacetate hydrolase family protein [Terriglobia bacterium]
MHVFRFISNQGAHLGVQFDRRRYDLTATAPEFRNMAAWLGQTDPIRCVHNALATARRFPLPGHFILLPPIDNQEVWASGVTYLRSKTARMEESKESADIYDRVYDAERPELFFKASPSRVRGPGMPIRIRRDSTWNVPEPELVLVMSSHGEIIGATAGNDVSSRSIEGDNPLYLPQAKIYEGSCAVGPMIELNDGENRDRTIQLSIMRGGAVAFSGDISTSQMRRRPEELANWLFRELSFPS